MADGKPGSRPGALSRMPAPHLVVRMSTTRMAWLVFLSLLPAAAWGVFLFGIPALVVLGFSIGTAVLAELASTLPFGRFTLRDGSAALTGCIVGLLMPAGVPLYVPAAAAAFAILVIKQTFGGLGRNWMNPAMGGVVFALLSWPGPMSRWIAPRGGAGADAAIPPLDALRTALAAPGAEGGTPLAVLSHAGFTFSALDSQVTGWVNAHVLAPLGTALPPGSFDVLVGHVAGGIGTVSAPFLMLGAWFLLSRRIIRWHLPVFYAGTFSVLAAVFGGLGSGHGWFAGGPGFHLLSGSLVLGAFFAAPDPVTSPLADRSRCILGAGLGVLTFLLRFFGSLGDGVAASIILGNCVVPLLDRWTLPRGFAEADRGGV
jgi:electron transport complex protein RnfD